MPEERITAEELDAAPASGVYAYLSKELSPQWILWDPDTILLELYDVGIDPSQSLWDKILAVQAVLTAHKWYQEAVGFANTVLAFNGIAIAPKEIFPEATPPQIAWFLLEMRSIRKSADLDTNIPWSYEPPTYTALILKTHYYEKIPRQLAFAKEACEMIGGPTEIDRVSSVDSYLERQTEAAEEFITKLLKH